MKNKKIIELAPTALNYGFYGYKIRKEDFGIGYLSVPGEFANTNSNWGEISSKTLFQWHSCRETFHRVCTRQKVKKFLFRTPVPNKVIAFMEGIQDKLKLEGSDRLKILRTNFKNIVCVFMSRWWRVQIRRSLLTVLLRASRSSRVNSWEAIGPKNKYLGNQIAFRRFMNGHTKYNGQLLGGWRSALGYRTEKEIKKKLLKG
jgi:hypothetical protein